MSLHKCSEFIVYAIDHLIKNGISSDLERICRMLNRRNGLQDKEALEILDHLVERRMIVKIKSKGITTYRNLVKRHGIVSMNVLKKRGSTCFFCSSPTAFSFGPKRLGILECKVCNVEAHDSCAKYPEETSDRVMPPKVWQCPECKLCSVCFKGPNEDEDDVLVCDLCEHEFHMMCHNPPVTVKPTPLESWMCFDCDSHNFLVCKSSTPVTSTSVDTEVLPPTYVESLEDGLILLEACLESYPKVVPNARTWTVDKVVTFFRCVGFSEEEVSVFKKQKIDGPALMTLRRDDVLNLNLKLGPALKIYSHIRTLQPSMITYPTI